MLWWSSIICFLREALQQLQLIILETMTLIYFARKRIIMLFGKQKQNRGGLLARLVGHLALCFRDFYVYSSCNSNVVFVVLGWAWGYAHARQETDDWHALPALKTNVWGVLQEKRENLDSSCLFKGRFLLCSPGCLWTHDLPTSASSVMGFQVCTTMFITGLDCIFDEVLRKNWGCGYSLVGRVLV